MNKLLPISLLIIASGAFGSASAQNVRVGMKAGINYTGIRSAAAESTRRRIAPVAGIFAQIPLSADEFWLLQPELLYSQKGVKVPYFDATYNSRLNYIDIPIFAKINTNGLSFELGPQISFLAAIGIDSPDGTSNDLSDTNRVVAGGVAGVGYQLPMGLGLGLRYTHDLSRITPQGPRNSVFQAQASYLLGSQ